MTLLVGEALTPGSAHKFAETSVNAGAPALEAGGILAGEALSATAPIGEGARTAIDGLGIETTNGATAASEDTLPTTPLGG